MEGDERTDCLNAETLIDYFSNTLDPQQAAAVERHLADCDACTARANQARELSGLWSQWTARIHGHALRTTKFPSILVNALERLAAERPQWRERIREWKEGAHGAVSVILDNVASASEILTGGLEDLLVPQPTWQFAEEVAPGHRSIVQGGESTQFKATVVETIPDEEGKPKARVAIDRFNRTIVVSIDNFPKDKELPLVLLLDATESAEPQLALMQEEREYPNSDPNLQDLRAEFLDLPTGHYITALE